MAGVNSGSGRLTLHVAALIDGSGAPLVPDAAIVIQGGTIRWAGPAVAAPGGTRPDAEPVAYSGGGAGPGFLRAPVHLPLVAHCPPYQAMAPRSGALVAFAPPRDPPLPPPAGRAASPGNRSR